MTGDAGAVSYERTILPKGTMTNHPDRSAGRISEQSLSNAGTDAMPTGSYWEAHRYIGAVPLSPDSRVQVNTVLKDGAWYVRLRAYRRTQRGTQEVWEAARQILIFPPETLPLLRALLTAAEHELGVIAGQDLSAEELAREGIVELPGRDALTILDATLPPTPL